MKPSGFVRKLDQLGRLVIPSKLRRTFNIEDQDQMEFYVDSNQIILKKYVVPCDCIFCGSADETISFKGKNVCKECLGIMKSKK